MLKRSAILILIFAAAAIAQTPPPRIAVAQQIPETADPGPSQSPEIRDYSWNHLPKQNLIQDKAPQWIPQHSVQTDGVSQLHPLQLVPLAPVVQSSFPGNAVDDFDPPDPTMAAGPNHVITVVNYTISINTKTGKRVLFRSLRNWFATLPELSGSYLYDVKTIYDQYNQHYILLCLAFNPHAKRSWIFFSVSKTSDPLGNWAFWPLDMGLNNLSRAAVFADFPGLGYDSKAIYLTANMLDISGNFKYAKIRVLKKSQVYSFSKLYWHDFWGLNDTTGSKGINIQPAQSFGDTTVEYLLSTNAVRGNKLTQWIIHNPDTTPTISKRGIPVSSYEMPPSAPQKGGGAEINTGDAGVVNVVFRNGILYAANAVSYNWGSGVNAAIRYYQVQASGVLQQEITYGSAGFYYYYPAVMANSQGNVTIVFNRSGKSEFAGIRVTGRKATDAAGQLQNAVALKAGLANYEDPILDGLNPWGDYNGIAVDADDSVWVFSEYVKTRIAWATQVGRLHF